MVYVLVLLAVVVAGGLLYLARLPGDYLVRRSLTLATDRQTVFDKVRDFRSWKEWSPWLMHEPDARLEFSQACDQEGGSYRWDGKRLGAGTLTHLRFDAPQRIDQRIEFTRPFKAVADVWWEFAERDGGTEVSWCMRGSMPFLFRFMTGTIRDGVEKDYELGLAMLHGLLVPGAERPLITFLGEARREPLSALTLAYRGEIGHLAEAMRSGFARLARHAAERGAAPAGRPLTAYHKVDPKRRQVECDMALPLGDGVEPGEFARRRFGGGRYFELSLQGSYDFLELAWYSAMSHLRMHKLKPDGSRPMLEVYENDPEAVAHSNELRTTLAIPLR